MIEHDALITEYSHEASRTRAAEALHTLQRVASVVKPLMRARGWRVGVLAEFFPAERNLLGLNWNRGQKICLRLRHAGDERQFLPFEDVVDTMLHELSHIAHGAHDAAFHALWNQLRDEHEALLRKGYTGEGFLSKGRKLGGASRIPMHEARRRARAAAEKRRSLTAGSGQRLGGRPVRIERDIRSVIADAAQRRIDVTRGCAAAEEEGQNADRRRQLVDEAARNGERTKALEDDADERAIMEAYIELVQEEERERFGDGYVPPSQDDPMGSLGQRKAAEQLARAELAAVRPAPPLPNHSKPAPLPTHSKPAAPPEQPAAPKASRPSKQPAAPKQPALPPEPVRSDPRPPSPPSPQRGWACEICTLHNPPSYLVCDACGTERSFESTAPHPPASAPPAASAPNGSRSDSANFTPSHQIERSLKRSRSAKTLQKLASLRDAEQSKPLGWVCARCGTFMETEWWTCASCGSVKASS